MEYTDKSTSAQVHSDFDNSSLLDLLGISVENSPEVNSAENCSLDSNIGCDLPITVSIFADVNARQVRTEYLSLRQLQARLTSIIAPDKASLPLIKLGTFGEARSERGSLRTDANLLSVTGIEGDYDAGKVSPLEAQARLDRAGIAALIYTTPRHTLEAPRWRILVPCRRR